MSHAFWGTDPSGYCGCTDCSAPDEPPHEHVWVEVCVWCELCGDHEGLRCDTEDCPDDYDVDYIDLVFNDDPREQKTGS